MMPQVIEDSQNEPDVQLIPEGYVPLQEAMGLLGRSRSTLDRAVQDRALRGRYVRRPNVKPERVYNLEDLAKLKARADETKPRAHKEDIGEALTTTLAPLLERALVPQRPLTDVVPKPPAIAITQKLWLSLEEAAEYSGISQANLRQLIDAGDLKALRIGEFRTWRILRESLEAFKG